MKKFLLVLLVGMVLAMNLHGIVNKVLKDEVKPVDHIKETTITVYTE